MSARGSMLSTTPQGLGAVTTADAVAPPAVDTARLLPQCSGYDRVRITLTLSGGATATLSALYVDEQGTQYVGEETLALTAAGNYTFEFAAWSGFQHGLHVTALAGGATVKARGAYGRSAR